MRRSKGNAGQMTIELAIAFPALVIVAVISVNALTFFGECAVFDRVTHAAVRTYAAAPAYGQGTAQSCALVEQELHAAIEASNVEVSVRWEPAGFDADRYVAHLEYAPTLFGMGLKSSVLGVSLPKLVHESKFVVDSYKAGVIF